MEFNCKLYFVGVEKRHSNKTGNDYHVLKVYDKASNSPFECFVSDVLKYKDYKEMQLYDFVCSVSKQGNYINVNII